MTLEGAKVKVVAELMPYSGGLKRNIVQCLNDYDIPLKLSHTVTEIHGKERVTGITISEVGPDRRPIPGSEEYYSCDTLLLSCGLIPENELSKGAGVAMSRVTNGPEVDDSLQTSIPGVYACGNVLHVHDLVDYVSEEAARAGRSAAAFLKGERSGEDAKIAVFKGEGGVRYTVPQSVDTAHMADEIVVRFRVGDIYKKKDLVVYYDDKEISRVKKRVMAPGEMEQIKIKKSSFDGLDVKEIRVCVEEQK
jgi:NADPH-dependent 2,4-dienoyl-CoA reductase/sulfur reductase-like enzyme